MKPLFVNINRILNNEQRLFLQIINNLMGRVALFWIFAYFINVWLFKRRYLSFCICFFFYSVVIYYFGRSRMKEMICYWERKDLTEP